MIGCSEFANINLIIEQYVLKLRSKVKALNICNFTFLTLTSIKD
jgi:hypothetical protein